LLVLLRDLLGIHAHDDRAGFRIERFAGSELLKLASWAAEPTSMMHFGDKRGNEVDFILDRRNRDIVGIEVKASRSVTSADFRGLRKLAGLAGERFVRGIVLYGGTQTLPFGPGLLAVPIGALWDLA
jgi:predicted AAA+ superfamily ATPase